MVGHREPGGIVDLGSDDPEEAAMGRSADGAAETKAVRSDLGMSRVPRTRLLHSRGAVGDERCSSNRQTVIKPASGLLSF